MSIVESWKRSIEFFNRKNISVFFLITCKTLIGAYAHVLKYFFTVVLFVIFVKMLLPYVAHGSMFYFLATMLYVLTVLSVRSSVVRKTAHYYASYWRHILFILVWPLCLIMYGAAFTMFSGIESIIIGAPYWSLLPLLFMGLFFCVGLLWLVQTILFFCDSHPTLKNSILAHVRAAKMLMYNMPVCLLVSVVMGSLFFVWAFLTYGVCNWLIYQIFGLHSYELSFYGNLPTFCIMLLGLPLEITVFSNLYIKWLHEQFALYFPNQN